MNAATFYSSFIATMAFGIIFNVPRRALASGGLVGMFGWVLYMGLITYYQTNMFIATLISAFSIATLSQFLARFHKMPATLYSVSGIIPLVPGGLAYDAIRRFMENNYTEGIQLATSTLLLAGAIAFGLIFSGVLTNTLHRAKQPK
ncbi:threonine/serine exporter family protein [Desulfitobacterium metallireducens]|uniref:Membrane protein n=1 Tax=Desulfitobacterium metallireducens DSM 15288 TaxID=871968 RepID=W0EA54_9FIRM|nr:threonine/serine exporter family protein [Desulfitobacterium metallireducens]AHF05941.1 membrane protein [Desulfitobacterium metallireducens DSM 15288]